MNSFVRLNSLILDLETLIISKGFRSDTALKAQSANKISQPSSDKKMKGFAVGGRLISAPLN